MGNKKETVRADERLRHIAFIMDGNGRWATKRMLPRAVGHKSGAENFRRIVNYCGDIGIKVVTVYAFSTENWGRPQAEINALFSLLVEYFYKEIDELDQNNVRIFILGDLSRFQPKLGERIESAVERTKNNTGLEFAIALNYGSRAEILNAIKSIVSEGILPEELTEDSVSRRLYTGVMHCPDPDLIIRTAGEQRLSNFLLWQAAYSEFVFTDTAFPDFTPEVYIGCIKEFMQRTRRFGKVL